MRKEGSQKPEASSQKLARRTRARSLFWLLATGSWLLTGSGCEAPPQVKEAKVGVNAFYAGEFSVAAERLRPLAQKTDENFVLNNCRLGSVALVQYDLAEAESAFLRAYEVMNSVGVNDGGRSLGAALVDEKIKIWKGEFFERAMASFYLGLSFYMRQDYANARGAFENALLKLRDAAEKEDRDEDYSRLERQFPIATIMLARCWQKLGRDDLARANFNRVAEYRSDLAQSCDPEVHRAANVVLIVDFGIGPRKVTDFDGSIVGFGPRPEEVSPIPSPRVTVNGVEQNIDRFDRFPTDLLVLAQDRRWQSIDTIRLTKSAIGTGMIAGGAGYGIYRAGSREGLRGEDAAIAAGLIGAGLLLKASSQADVRQWEMLPRSTFIIPLQLEPGKHDIEVDFGTTRGYRQLWRGLVAPEKGDATYYFRMQRFNSGPFDWPPAGMSS